MIMGKQSIDGDNNQTGQMLGALTGMGQGTFASELKIGDGAIEVCAGGRRWPADRIPEIACHRDDGPATKRAAIRITTKYYESQEKASRDIDARAVCRWTVQSHVTQIGVAPPPERAAGIKVEDVASWSIN